ncbi:hypothetical protein QUF64_12815 [Anaerolineales bacterium HSG6]|nr:hypothetical protein [Anaerolineales bacterium HSG6]
MLPTTSKSKLPASPPIEALVELWLRGKLSQDELLEAMLSHLVEQQQTINTLNQTVKGLRNDMDNLIAQTGIKPRF